MKPNDALRLFLNNGKQGMNFSDAEYVAAVAKILGYEPTKNQRAGMRCALQREGHDDRGGRTPGFRVFFAETDAGRAPSDLWRKAGGRADRRCAGNYVLLSPPSKQLVHWYKDRPESDSEKDGPDWYGRPRTGKTNEAIDSALRAVKGPDGSVTLAAVVNLFKLEGSRPRDRRNRARVYCGQSGFFQSIGTGKYYDITDPNVPSDVRREFIQRSINLVTDQAMGSNNRLFLLGANKWIDVVVRDGIEPVRRPLDLDPLEP